MLSLFPISARAKKGLLGLVVSIIIYAILAAILPAILGIFKWGSLLGKVVGIAQWVVGAYCTVGVIVSILAFLKIVK